ncbi:MAG: hypothetical protein AAF415_02355 [Pseudomonadota bacterium]
MIELVVVTCAFILADRNELEQHCLLPKVHTYLSDVDDPSRDCLAEALRVPPITLEGRQWFSCQYMRIDFERLVL